MIMPKIGKISINEIDYSIYDAIYPIGSVYISVNSTNPSLLFGGVWERFANGRCLVGVSESESEFSIVSKTGGEKTHTLSLSETPAHCHSILKMWGNASAPSIRNKYPNWPIKLTLNSGIDDTETVPAKGYEGATCYRGDGKPHNNLQPYITVYMWKRIS